MLLSANEESLIKSKLCGCCRRTDLREATSHLSNGLNGRSGKGVEARLTSRRGRRISWRKHDEDPARRGALDQPSFFRLFPVTLLSGKYA